MFTPNINEDRPKSSHIKGENHSLSFHQLLLLDCRRFNVWTVCGGQNDVHVRHWQDSFLSVLITGDLTCVTTRVVKCTHRDYTIHLNCIYMLLLQNDPQMRRAEFGAVTGAALGLGDINRLLLSRCANFCVCMLYLEKYHLHITLPSFVSGDMSTPVLHS